MTKIFLVQASFYSWIVAISICVGEIWWHNKPIAWVGLGFLTVAVVCGFTYVFGKNTGG